MFEAKFEDGVLFKRIVDAIKELVKNEHPEVSASGIVIVENDEDINNAIEKFDKENIGNINIQSFNTKETPINKRGEPDLISKHRSGFLGNIK